MKYKGTAHRLFTETSSRYSDCAPCICLKTLFANTPNTGQKQQAKKIDMIDKPCYTCSTVQSQKVVFFPSPQLSSPCFLHDVGDVGGDAGVGGVGADGGSTLFAARSRPPIKSQLNFRYSCVSCTVSLDA